ncbi:MAG: EAL domain-containing protein [Rudaea sp.]|nr:EAL domain-containing protein [Rudaea sp.]
MHRRGKIILTSALAALAGMAMLFASIAWVLWRESVASEEVYGRNLAASLGASTERIFLDARDMLMALDKVQAVPCSGEHLRLMQEAAIARPYIRAIGYWRATERLCGVGVLPSEGLKPAHADRIYDSGLIAWWPSPQTAIGGVQLFLMRFGDHDVVIDPRLLLDLGSTQNRQAVLWVENLRMSATPWDVALPTPDSLPMGVTLDRKDGTVVSRYSDNKILPIDVVAMEPIDNFWSRHARMLATGGIVGVLLVAAWFYVFLRFYRYRLSLAAELREALEAGQIQAHYQPVMELKSGRCVGAEALARWQREDGEWVSPALFIPVAEKEGMIQDVTLAMLKIVIRDMQAVLTGFLGISININLAPDDLKNDRVGRELMASLAAAALSPHTIKLEITERALVNSDTSRSLIREFRQRGHQVAIDDFGTGYSSLSYLQSFELDVLKIDKSFVDAIGTEAATSQVIVHVIEMAKSLGLTTVAEGVETRDQLDWLIAHDVPFGQGYLFSHALPAAAFGEFLRANRLDHAA